MNGESSNYSEYEELHNHKGTTNYEINTIFLKEYDIGEILFDKLEGYFFVYANTQPIRKENRIYKRRRISTIGVNKGEGSTSRILKNGTVWSRGSYSNWVINGDTTRRQYLKPFSDKNYDPKEWLLAFKDIYDEASASYYFNGTFYLKIDDQWNEVDKNFEVENFDFDKHFPDKYANVRMIELDDQSPAYYVPPEERDSSLIKEIGYESVYSEEIDQGWDSYTYSAGWWYFQLYMPGGDTLRIKRYSDIRNPHMKLYNVPQQYGGHKDVLFIVLEPKDAHFEQVGGMYVVRPRELKENN